MTTAKTAAEPKPAAAEAHQPDPPVQTIADEQRKRSEEMEKEGVAKYVAERDERPPGERVNKPVAGVNPQAGSNIPSSRR